MITAAFYMFYHMNYPDPQQHVNSNMTCGMLVPGRTLLRYQTYPVGPRGSHRAEGTCVSGTGQHSTYSV